MSRERESSNLSGVSIGHRIVMLLMLLGSVLVMVGPVASDEPLQMTPSAPEERIGEALVVSNQYGSFVQYVPTTLRDSPEIVVIVHGTPDDGLTALDDAQAYMGWWMAFAEEKGVILIAPAFDQENFGARSGPVGGYRALMGREIGADAFINRIVDYYQARFAVADDRFYLYGHSAGGQFVCRYMIVHPERVKGGVISAAGFYAFPDPTASWPYGMGRLQETARWDGAEDEIVIDITPDPDGWVKATQLPVTVVVGLNDTEIQPAVPGQGAGTRFRIGSNWVRAMTALAEARGVASQIEFSLVPGKGHSAGGIIPVSQDVLFRADSADTDG